MTKIRTLLLSALLAATAASGSIVVVAPPEAGGGEVAGTLSRDGAATPHQLALIVDSLGGLAQTATAEVRIRTGDPEGSWSNYRELFRVQPSNGESPPWGTADDIFAWVLFDLDACTEYDVQLRKTDGATVDDDEISTFTTKCLPAEPGAVDVTITAGSTPAQIDSALAGASPGDHIQFANGTYDTDDLTIPASLSGASEGSPTYITGESRGGVVLQNLDTDSVVIRPAAGLSNVVFQDLTIQGDGNDYLSSPPGYMSRAVYASADNITNLTFRRLTIFDVSQGIYFDDPGGGGSTLSLTGFLIYNNTITGTNTWDDAHFDNGVNYVWNDFGILVPGNGHATFQNTVSGFGDTFSTSSGPGNDPTRRDRSIHFYLNDVDNSGDDTFEADYSYRNLTYYKNRHRNVINAYSVDPIYGGPLIFARNIFYNVAETRLYKWNTTSSGFFTYSNTYVKTDGIYRLDSGNDNLAFYYQPNAGGSHYDVGYANNLHIKTNGGFSGTSGDDYVLWFTPFFAGGRDIHHNGWFPDGNFQIGDGGQAVGSSLAAFQADQPAASGIFENMQMFANDVIAIEQPFVTTITLGADYSTEVAADYAYSDFELSGSGPQNQGIAVEGITNDFFAGETFSGAAPDIGAVVRGLTNPVVGDQTNGIPSYASDMVDYEVRQLTGSYAPVSGFESMEDVTPTAWVNEDVNGPGRTFYGVISAYSGGSGSVVTYIEDARLVVHGGGHNDSGNNGFYLYDVRESGGAPTGWENGVDISDNGIVVQGTGPAESDGRARSVHTYSGLVFAPDRNLYYRHGGAIFNGNGGVVQHFWEYDPTAAQGSRWTQLTNVPGASNSTMGAFYDQATGKTVAIDPGAGAWVYDIDAGTWSSEAGLTLFDNFDTTVGYDPSRNTAVVTMNNGNARYVTFNLSTDTITAQGSITWTGDTAVVSDDSARVYDPTLDVWWFVGGSSTANYDTIAYATGADLAAGGNVAVTEVALSANMAATGFNEGIVGTFNRTLLVDDARLLFTVHRVDEAPWAIKLPDSL